MHGRCKVTTPAIIMHKHNNQVSQPKTTTRQRSIQKRHEISAHLRNNPNIWQRDIELLVDHRTIAHRRMPKRTYNMTIAKRVKKSGVRANDNIIATATAVLHQRDIAILLRTFFSTWSAMVMLYARVDIGPLSDLRWSTSCSISVCHKFGLLRK